MNILIIGPAWVGDMVLAQSLFKLLKQRHPDCRLDVVAPAWTLPVLARMREVDTGIALDVMHGELALGKRLALAQRLRARGYERAIVLPNSFKSAIVPYAARIPRRSGFLGELRYGLLNDVRKLDKRKLKKTVERFVALGLDPNESMLASLPAPELIANREGMHGPAKRWPMEYFAELARAKLTQGWEVWLFGSHRDAPITHAIDKLTGSRCLDLAGRTSLAESIDLLSLATVVVSNDSGLMHIAAALKRKLVAIYGSTDPRHTPPMSANATVLYLGLECSPCFKRECPLGHLNCLKHITSQQVETALRS